MFQLNHTRANPRRRATVAVLVAMSITLLLGIVAISIDGGLLQDNKRRVQNATDAAALAAATSLFKNYPSIKVTNLDPGGQAVAAAKQSAADNGFADNETDTFVVVNIPPKSGPFTGKMAYVEVIITYEQPRYFSTIWGSSATAVVARAAGKGYWGGTSNGILVLDPTAQNALDSSGNGSVTVTGGAAVIVDSNDSASAGRVTGGGALTSSNFQIVGAANGTFNGPVTTGILPVPDPLAYLPVPTKPPAGKITKTNKSGSKIYTLTPGSYTSLPNLGNGDTMILQQGGIYYLDGGGFTSTNGATIMMDPNTTGGVMFYNAPNGTQQNQGINLSGGTVNLSPLTSGPYAGIIMWQDRTSPVSLSIQGQGGMTILGTFYAANALMSVTGQGTNTIGSQYISRTLSLSGGGDVLIDYRPDLTARLRDVRLVE